MNPPILAAHLGNLRVYKPCAGARHDVGGGLMLTVSQIAKRSGCQPTTIYARINAGRMGAELLRPSRVKSYPVGDELMTISEISERTGLAADSIRSRLARGVKGRGLLRKERRDLAAPRSSTMTLAIRLADRFPSRLPTTAEIRKLYPMSAQSAERWLTSLREARRREVCP